MVQLPTTFHLPWPILVLLLYALCTFSSSSLAKMTIDTWVGWVWIAPDQRSGSPREFQHHESCSERLTGSRIGLYTR